MASINSDDPYQVLGVSQNASKTEIRAAYRKLALRHHPDKQTTPEAKQEANEKFSKISHAYEQLSDDTRRREYDYQRQTQDYFPSHYAFHDPFQVFASVFQEFGGGAPFGATQQQHPFFSQQQDPFMADPFFGASMFGGGSMFGGDVFSQMNRQMDMMRQQHQQQSGMPPNNGHQSSSSYYYSSSSSNYGNHTGESVTTTTRMINGRRQTVTERTVRKPDGSVERHVETTGDEDFPLPAHRLVEQPEQRPQLPPATRDTDHNTADAETQPTPWKKMKRRMTGHKDDK